MGIYIKRMDMPKNCGECFVGNRTICSKHCPLTEVLEPHGRLIDADALADDLEADGKEFGDEMKLNCASWIRSNATLTVIERSK